MTSSTRFSLRPAESPAQNAGANRREHERITAPPLFVSGVWATVCDISQGGICLRLKERLEPGARYELILTDGLNSHTQEVGAEVVWCGGGRAGLRWVGLEPEQQRWLNQRFQAWLRERDGEVLLNPITP
jgi:hypothetical protein